MSATVPAPQPEIVLQVHDLALAGSPPGLKDVNLTMRAGESAALLGDDQVFLTRIIRVIGGLERPRSGTVLLLGVDVGNATRGQLLALRRRVGYVSIAGGLLSNMTVRENVEIALRYHERGDAAFIRARADALLAEGGLVQLAEHPASVIPAEYQKCAAYVRALACEPDFLLVEDPAAFLHPEGRATIERIHARLRAIGTTVLLADDDVALASRLATRAIWFSGATITADGAFASPPPLGAATDRTETP